MGITIEAGNSFNTVTTSKIRFTKGPGEVTEGAAAEVNDTFIFQKAPAEPAPSPQPSGNQPLRFRDLDAGTRSQYKDTVKDLATSGRLYVRDEQNQLRRADPMEIKERLDRGQPVELVSRVASESSSSGSSSSYSFDKQRGFFTEGFNIARDDSTRRSSERVFYTTSPVTDWDSLDFATPGQGVRGVAVLPASGGSVEVSNSYESKWSSRANEQWGIFTNKEKDSQAGGYTKVTHTAD